jgi:hypothetical protein
MGHAFLFEENWTMHERYPSRRLFAVVFKPDNCNTSALTREFPDSMAVDPKPFFHDGYSPENDILRFLKETWDGNLDFMAYGHVRHTRQGNELHDELRVERFKGPPYAPHEKAAWERTCTALLGETKKSVYAALDESRTRLQQKIESGQPTERPADMGVYDFVHVDNRNKREN